MAHIIPECHSWSRVEAQGDGPSPRDKLASAVIGTNIYIFGGFGPQDPDEEEVGVHTTMNKTFFSSVDASVGYSSSAIDACSEGTYSERESAG